MGYILMHIQHIKCTAICAAESQYLKGIRRGAQITHIFLELIYRNHNVIVMKLTIAQKSAKKVSCENAVQCVQSLESVVSKGWELHS